MEALWPSTFVSEANLTNTIVSLRKVLGQDAIRTVSKHGYRFVMPVQGEPGIAREIYEKFARAKELTVQRSVESTTRARELYWLCLAEAPTTSPPAHALAFCCQQRLPSIRGIIWVREAAMRNFHLPLPEQTYMALKAEAERNGVPATTLAREAVDWWLRQQVRKARHDAIAAYAAKMAGTRPDLDTDLESAAIEHILNTSKATK